MVPRMCIRITSREERQGAWVKDSEELGCTIPYITSYDIIHTIYKYGRYEQCGLKSHAICFHPYEARDKMRCSRSSPSGRLGMAFCNCEQAVVSSHPNTTSFSVSL